MVDVSLTFDPPTCNITSPDKKCTTYTVVLRKQRMLFQTYDCTHLKHGRVSCSVIMYRPFPAVLLLPLFTTIVLFCGGGVTASDGDVVPLQEMVQQ